MADERTFTLVGNFKDNITPSLKKLNAQLAATTKSFEKMQKMVRPIAKDMAIMGDASSRMVAGMGGQRNAFETNLRAMKQYRSELGKISSTQRQLERKFKVPAAPFAPAPTRPPLGGGGGGGGGGARPPVQQRPFVPDMGDGFTIEKGVIANLATNFVQGIFNQMTGAVGKAVNFLKGGIQERIEDEMGDIQSAGGILSIGKEYKVAWADTYDEAFGIQKRLNAEMANLAAALPGETGQYVANMKQVTDTVMKVNMKDTEGMVKAMQEFNSSVKTSQDAYVEATKQLAKYTTLGNMGNTGGVSLTALSEQLINSDKVSIKALKRTYNALEKNPLVSGALEKYEKEMNKAGAGSAERYKLMIKAFQEAFPAEVLDAMTNSAEGIYQGLKSGLLDAESGFLGLGKAYSVSFAGIKNSMGPAIKELSVFDMFLKFFKTLGMLLGPIVSILPKIMNPFAALMNPLREFYVNAENTISNFKAATKMFQGKKLDMPDLRGSLLSIGKLAKALGGNKAEFAKLEGMLMSGKLDIMGAIQQAMKVLFSSDALKRFGQAMGKSLGGFFKMLAGMAQSGGQFVNQGGLLGGFLQGWSEAGGTKAIMDLVKMIVETVVKTIIAAGLDIIRTDPVTAAFLAAVFYAPFKGFLIKWLGIGAKQLGAALLQTQLGASVTSTIAGWAGAIVPTLATIGTTIATTVAGWAGAIIPAVTAMASGLMTFFTVTLPAVLAPLLVPALIVGAIIGLVVLIYKFKDQISGAITALQGFIAQNFSGGLRDMLLGITNTWKGLLQMVTGLVDTVMGFFTGDKDRMGKGLQSIRDGANKWVQGMKQSALGALTGVKDAIVPLLTDLKNGLTSAASKIANFLSPLTNWLSTYLLQPLGVLFKAIGMRITQGFQAYIGFITTYIITPVKNALVFIGTSIVQGFQAYIGFVRTYVLTPVQNALMFIGSVISQGFQSLLSLVQTYVVVPVQTAFTAIGSALSQGFYALVGLVQTYIVAPLMSVFAQIQAGVSTAVSAILSAWQRFVSLLVGAFKNLGSLAGQVGSAISSAAMSGVQALGNAIKNAILNAASWISGGAIKPPAQPTKPPAKTPAKAKAKAKAKGEPGKGFGSLSSAVNYEMKNKPPGSDLVIANSSETVIPAAGGYGTQELFSTLQQGFANTKTTFERISQGVNINRQDMIAGFQQSEKKGTERANATNGRIDKYQQTTASQIAGIGQNVASLAAKVKEMSSFGGMMGGMGGGGAAGGGAGGAGGGMATGSGYGSKGSQIAGQLGTYIKQTGGAPGSIHEHPQHGGVKGKHSPNSYHYQGRAIDIGAYANEQGGVLSRIAQFNQKMGVKPVELLKAGDPGHSDHVHVAYNTGHLQPLFEEMRRMPSGAKVAAVNSSEMVANRDQTRLLAQTLSSIQPTSGPSIPRPPVSGPNASAPVTINAPITIHQQPGQSADELAMIVATKISEAVSDARAASILV